MALTTAFADEYLKGKLAGDSSLLGYAPGGAWRDQPPQDATYPFVVWQLLSGTVLRGAGPVRFWSDLVYQVKVVGKGPSIAGNLRSAADRIDALLDVTAGGVTGGQIVACTLEGEIAYTETVAGVVYQHLGGRYRLFARGT